MKIKLAEALLRRKELQEKVDQLRQVKESDMVQIVMRRQPISDSIDDITAKVPKCTIEEVTAAFDFHAKRLRQIDALVQQANWNTEIDVDDSVMADFSTPKA